MKSNIVIDILLLIPYLKEFLFSNYGPKCCQPIKWQDSLKCNISRKKWMMEFIFSVQINREIFYKWILSFWMCVTRHAQVPKIWSLHIFAISLKIMRDEADFFPADTRQRFLEIDTIILGVCGQACPCYPK